MKLHLPVLTACLLSAATCLQAQNTFVIPKVPVAGGNGSSGNNLPGTGSLDFRGQWSYAPSEWPDKLAKTITRIRCRASDFASTATSWTGGVYPKATIKMSTGTAAYNLLTNNFANNAGKDEVVVYQGPITIKPGKGTGGGVIGQYYMDVTLQKTFTYDPSKGPLLVEWITAGNTTIRTTSAAMTTLNNSMRYFRRGAGAHNSTTATTIRSRWGLIMELTTRPPSGLLAGFTATPSTGGQNLKVQFTDTSFSSAPGGVLTRTWDFGDGSPKSNAKNPTHTYKCGTFSPSLTVTDSQHKPSTLKKTGLIEAGLVAANFSQDKTNGGAPLTVTFTDKSTGGPIAYSWDFGDGSPKSNAKNPKHTYTKGGNYDVSLSIIGVCNTDKKVVKGAVFVRAVGTKCLSTTFAGGNGLTANGSGNMFDIEVKNRSGIKITELEVSSRAAANTPITIEVWTSPGSFQNANRPGTATARDNQRAKWIRVSKGTAPSAGGAAGNKTIVDIGDFLLPAGKWGMYVRFLTGGIHYTNGNATNQKYSNADLSFQGGIGKGGFFTGGVNNPRVWNGTICYVPGDQAAMGVFGYGCPGSNKKIPALSMDKAPVGGTTVTLSVTDMPAGGGLAWLFFGIKAQEFDLKALGAPNCFLQFNILTTAVVRNVGGKMALPLRIPVGENGNILVQAGIADKGANALGATASNGLALRAGK